MKESYVKHYYGIFKDIEFDALDKEGFLGDTRSKINNFFNQFKFTSTVGIRAYLRNRLSHLGTLMNILDNVNLKNTFFYDTVYQGLNRMHTKALRGYYNAQTMINSIAASIEGIESYQDLKQKLPFEPVKIDFGDTKYINKATGKAQEVFSVTQLMRIYALSKNETQRIKLENSGFGQYQISQIEGAIGTDAVEFVDKIVNISGKNLSITHDLTKPSINTKLALISDKAKRDLGWEYKTSIDDGIAKTIDWYRKNIKV